MQVTLEKNGNLEGRIKVEVGGERLAVVSGIAVHDVERLHGREIVLGRVGGEHTAHTRVETAAEDGREAGFLEAFAVGPLPGVFEMSHVARFVVVYGP